LLSDASATVLILKGGLLNYKKSLLITGAVASVTLAGIAGLGVASAATNNPQPNSIIDKIATKFNLNRNDVAPVFEEDRAEHEAEHQQQVEDRLTQAVADGKITEAQKAKILAKLKEIQTNREAWKGKTPEERHKAMKELHDSLQKWADENGISLEYLHMGMGGPHGPRHW